MSKFILVTKETYPFLLNGFINGADQLSAGNVENEGRDKRPGKTGGEIARSERSINRKLKALSHERDLNDSELELFGNQFYKEKGVFPSISDIDKLVKPLELNDDPCWLELNDSEHERFLLYYSAAKWFVRASELAADILDVIEAAPSEKIKLTAEKEYGNHT